MQRYGCDENRPLASSYELLSSRTSGHSGRAPGPRADRVSSISPSATCLIDRFTRGLGACQARSRPHRPAATTKLGPQTKRVTDAFASPVFGSRMRVWVHAARLAKRLFVSTSAQPGKNVQRFRKIPREAMRPARRALRLTARGSPQASASRPCRPSKPHRRTVVPIDTALGLRATAPPILLLAPLHPMPPLHFRRRGGD